MVRQSRRFRIICSALRNIIITQKPKTALKVAYFLKENSIKFAKNYNNTYFIVDETKIVCNSSGHILIRQYKKQDNNWFKVDAQKIIDCEITQQLKNKQLENILNLFKNQKDIQIGIFTDFDNEGELIGFDISEFP